MYRFEGAVLVNGRCNITGRKKTGKTTMLLSVIDSYLTGSPLLGYYPMVGSFDRRVLYMSYELNERYMWSELERTGLLATNRLDIWNLRWLHQPTGHRWGLADDAGVPRRQRHRNGRDRTRTRWPAGGSSDWTTTTPSSGCSPD